MANTSAWRLTWVEMVTMRAMPDARARVTTASSSPAKSGKSRWQWLSTNVNAGGKRWFSAMFCGMWAGDQLPGTQQVLTGHRFGEVEEATLPCRVASVQA